MKLNQWHLTTVVMSKKIKCVTQKEVFFHKKTSAKFQFM